MKEDFYVELADARQKLIDQVNAQDWNGALRVRVEDMIILVDQLLEIRP